MRTLAASEIQAFRRDGIVKVPGAVPPDLAAEMLASVDRVLGAPGATGMFGMDRRVYAHDEQFRRRSCTAASSRRSPRRRWAARRSASTSIRSS